MSISPAGCFDYRVVVGRRGRVWRGRGATISKSSIHPGLAGGRPHFELTNGVVTIDSTDSWLSHKINPHFRFWGPPASSVCFSVGAAPEIVLEAGDVLRLSRYGTTDLAFSIRKGEHLKVGLGAVVTGHLDPDIRVEEDPRANETSLRDVIWWLEQPNSTLIWLDVSDVDHTATFRDIEQAPGGSLVIAIAGEDADKRRQMNHRVSELCGRLPPGPSAYRFVDVDARFKTQDEWLRYLRGLPTSRPDDLWLRIHIGHVSVTLREGAYAFVDPWHLFVRKVYEPGLPGRLSQLGIARSHPAITQTALMESTNAVASRGIGIRE